MKDAVQHAHIDLKRGEAQADLSMTPSGLVAIGAMVGAILIGSAVIVAAARRPGG